MTTEERSGVEGVEGVGRTGGQAASAGPGGAAILSLEQIEDEVGMLVRGGGDADRVLTQFMALRSALATAERRAEEAESMFRDYALAAQTIGFESSAAGIEDPDGTLVGIYRNTLTALASERAARERAERERDVLRAANREAESQFVAELEAKRTAESSLSRAVEALRGAEAHHDEQARLWADNESDGEADLNAQYHSERRDVFTAVLAEVGK